jgi:pyruvate/2-oxoglutarate dehydrogenase complex dihydrolipoamide dehydrogenase (E3) component
MSGNFDFDLVVIGGGSGGYAAARTAAQAGLRTAVVEGGKEVGGLCILRGCMPTKALLYAADVLHLARHAPTWGIRTNEVSFDLDAVMDRKDRLIREFAEYRQQQLQGGKFTFIRALAKFQDPHSVLLSTGQTISSKHFLISTGSIVAPPPLPQLQEVGYLTSDEALTLRQLPRSILVLGGGAVAVEFAQFFQRFGVQVTLVQRSHHVLRDFDSDAAHALETAFERDGMKIYHNTQLTSAHRSAQGKVVNFLCQGRAVSVEADEIFYALGRIPNTARLDLDRAGVTTDGLRIIANTQMQTTAPHIYAAGDCTGPYEIVHIAIQQGEAAAYNMSHASGKRRLDYRLLINVIFTEPQVASVGLTEKEAETQNIPCRVAKYPFNDHGKSLIMEALDGFVKLLADPATGEILGGCVVGPMGGELIHEIAAAMFKRMTVHELAAMPHYHPTLAEIWTYPAEELAEQISGKRIEMEPVV